MIVLKGNGVFGGISFGKLSVYKKENFDISPSYVDDVDSEINRYKLAKERAKSELDSLYNSVLSKIGKEEADIFQIHKMMIDDADYCKGIEDRIKSQKVKAEYAILKISEEFIQMFSLMDDDYMKERAADVKDISMRLIKILCGKNEIVQEDEECIIGAEDLSPSETIELSGRNIKGFVTVSGSCNSHTAILAKTMGIPAVVGVGGRIKKEFDGCSVILDGYSGTVYINPEVTTIERLKKKQSLCEHENKYLQGLKGMENITKDGKKIEICANIGNASDINGVLQNDAEGIGLFRSEFLYLRRNSYPSEKHQYEIYKKVLQKMNDKKVIIRTLDIGADKKVSYFNLPKEENPAMGYRAIRICLDRPNIFKTQLRAIYRASVYGKVSIMFPMIISIDELKKAKKIIEEVKYELTEEGVKYSDDVEIGVMIETPAAVMISDELAKEVDFFSIGTNDLTQYTLAVDRQNNKINKMYDPHHKAILKMIKIVADNAHKNGIWVGICGELASDEELTETFLSFGIDELSMSAPFILNIRKKVRDTDVSKIKETIIKNFI